MNNTYIDNYDANVHNQIASPAYTHGILNILSEITKETKRKITYIIY